MSDEFRSNGMLLSEENGDNFSLHIHGKPIANVGKSARVGTIAEHKQSKANAARLAACWNAFEPFPLELVERMGRFMAKYNRDELAALLAEEGE